ncbi:hypothetical protein KBTX_00223 [wastewater metagenome]|uniref:DUF192 domain-containing protein n=2 Tax=unclassified sequences TaxID=12908 RepID=A0A5B8R9D5_9ZZZZ|nr:MULTISPECIES: DUF192 domain-containing protein [Arhodomonas]MCS4504124.1 DUF192 domain-containing protein [Arhodomonas aquaeolei]QEA03922.1 hypothetical protein KBTEX_00223 [uncultured organism]
MRAAPRILLIAFVTVGVLVFGRPGPAGGDDPESRGLAVWRGMEQARVILPGDAGALTVRVADEGDERAQGMQYVPAPEIRRNPIWFSYPASRVTHWHMHNVALPLDIVWMDADGRILEIARMEPGRDGYRSPPGVRHALELAAGTARRLGLEVGDRLTPPGLVR